MSGAERLVVRGAPPGDGHPEEVRDRARELGLLGWVRREDDGELRLHVEGAGEALAALRAQLSESAPGAAVEAEPAAVEGHEQFAVRGVPAGSFVVREHAATARHFDFRLEVDGTMRSWAVPKGPSMDPAAKRLAIQVPDHGPSESDREGAVGDGAAIVWDRGDYERGGRVPWPEALDRGHAVFVLRGEKLRDGFALQRTGGGKKPHWLLVKRRDEEALPGSDVVAEYPLSPLSGRALDELLEDPGER